MKIFGKSTRLSPKIQKSQVGTFRIPRKRIVENSKKRTQKMKKQEMKNKTKNKKTKTKNKREETEHNKKTNLFS